MATVLTPRWRSAPLAIFLVALLILGGAFAVIVQNEHTYGAARDRQTTVEAQVLAASVAAAVDFGDSGAAQEAVDAFRANPQVRFVGVYGRDGRPLAAYDRSNRSAPVSLSRVPPASPRALRVDVPIASRGQTIGSVLFEVDREATTRRLTRYAILGALWTLAVLVIASLWIAQRTLRRANRDLAGRAEALSQANVLLKEQMEEREKAEEQLRQSQKMQALGQLTGGIAHDFNNLLTVIQGAADMLGRDELPEDRRKRFTKAIIQAADNAAVLTSQLLAFARRQPLKPEQVDLNRMVVDMAELIDRTMGEKIEVVTELANRPCGVIVDRAQLQSALLNVASNARDAMADGGRIRLKVCDPSGPADNRTVAIEIRDTGAGMDEETLGRIFEPFFTTKKAGKGTGLGLSQVYGFASQSGGDVKVSSEPGEGTTVTILLPCCDPTGVDASEAATSEIRAHPAAHILVVEDNEEVGAFAETLLTELGHDVTRASTGEEAIELARSRKFDVVFSDVVMPGMGGLRLAEMLRDEQPSLPVVLATGYSEEIVSSGSGGRPVILKPYRLAVLADALADAMQMPGSGGTAQ